MKLETVFEMNFGERSYIQEETDRIGAESKTDKPFGEEPARMEKKVLLGKSKHIQLLQLVNELGGRVLLAQTRSPYMEHNG